MTSETMSVSNGTKGAIEPRGAKPKKLTAARIGVYAFLVISALFFLMPLYVMIVTSLKGLPEIRLGLLFNLPQEITFEPWLKAWDTACTGRDCNGLKPGFINSLKITLISVPISIVVAMLKGSELLFGILIFGAFVPYQVVIYPLIIGLREVGLFGTLPGIVIVHTIFGMPILTLLFRNFFASLPPELFKAARVDGAGFWQIFFQIMLPMSVPIAIVAVILQTTGIWNDFLFGTVFAGRENMPMTVQLNNIVTTTTGLHQARCLPDDGSAQQYRAHLDRNGRVQHQHGGNRAHGRGTADRLFRVR